MLYSIAFFVFAVGTCTYPCRVSHQPHTLHRIQNARLTASALYLTRARWLHLLPRIAPGPLYQRLPTSFRDDIEAGLHSTDFDLTGNVEGDSRQGLDDAGKKEVLRIMKRKNVGFDEARRLLMQERFSKAGVGSDGVPRDPKFVSFS